mmetsp:Transcript_3930/g.13178  ORF Transcript_3930/g.13178 Transcript_3930/m.13178 type:complete len:367 (-) Transcript_3930:589-1689(-)
MQPITRAGWGGLSARYRDQRQLELGRLRLACPRDQRQLGTRWLPPGSRPPAKPRHAYAAARTAARSRPALLVPPRPRGPHAALVPAEVVRVDVFVVAAALDQEVLEVVAVHPEVGRDLLPLDHGPGLVEGAVVRRVGVRVEHRRPHERMALARAHSQVEVWEGCLAACLHVVEVHEEGEQARAPGRVREGVLVVVTLVELARLVPEHLQVLGIGPRDADEVCDARAYPLEGGVLEALGHVAPRGGGGAHGGHAVPGEGPLEVVPAFGHEGRGLLLGEKRLELHDPGGRGEHPRRVGRALGGEAAEESVQVPGVHGGAHVSRAHARLLPLVAAHAAGEGAPRHHPRGVGRALPLAPLSAPGVAVVAV